MSADKPLTLEDLEAMPPSRLLLPGEVAQVLRVDPKTVTRWALGGKLSSVRTLGGHRRYRVGVVLQMVQEAQGDELSAR